MGEQTIDIMSGNTPEAVKENPYLLSLMVGLTYVAEKPTSWDAIQTSFLWAVVFDQRAGGFGPLMGPIAGFGLILIIILSFHWRNRTIQAGSLLALALLISFFIHPESWWARYVPQFWIFFVLIAMVARQALKTSPAIRILSGTMLGLMLVNSLGTAWASWYAAHQRHVLVMDSIIQMSHEETYYTSQNAFFGALLWRLEDHGITIVRAEPLCADPILLAFSFGREFCPQTTQYPPYFSIQKPINP
jgi:biotin transporter BioY